MSNKYSETETNLRSADGICRFQIALVSILAVAAAFILVLGAEQAQANSMRTGVSEFEDESRDLGLELFGLQAERVRDSGSTYFMQWLRWDFVAPETQPAQWDPDDPAASEYDWAASDRRVVSARHAGLEPVFQIYGAPKWAQRCDPPTNVYVHPPAPCDPDPEMLADFAQAAARRYSGSYQGLPRVKYWQILNEPNLHVFFNPQFGKGGSPVSPAIYRNILRVTYPAIKSGNEGNVVIAAGLAPNGISGYSLGPLDFARRLFCLSRANRPLASPNACGRGVKLDVFDMHPYTSGGPTHKAEGRDNVQMGNLSDLKRLLSAADKAGRISGSQRHTPLWVTEMSWDSSPPDPGGVSMKILTRWASEAIYQSWKAGVRVFFWYSLRDQAKNGLPWRDTTQSGLYFRSSSLERDRPKRSLKAFRFPFVAYSMNKGPKRKGAALWGRTPQGKPGKVVIQVKRKAGWRRLVVKRANSHGLFRGFVRSRLASGKRGFVRASFRGQKSPPFSLKPVKDFRQRPFG